MNELIYCKKCHDKKRVMSYEKAVKELNEKYPNYKVVDKCMSTCGFGKKKFFMQLEDEIIMKETFEKLLEE